jgi:hypothetical protein
MSAGSNLLLEHRFTRECGSGAATLLASKEIDYFWRLSFLLKTVRSGPNNWGDCLLQQTARSGSLFWSNSCHLSGCCTTKLPDAEGKNLGQSNQE